MNDNEKAFMLGLSKLTHETGIAVYSCGCCTGIMLVKADGSGYSCTDDGCEIQNRLEGEVDGLYFNVDSKGALIIKKSISDEPER